MVTSSLPCVMSHASYACMALKYHALSLSLKKGSVGRMLCWKRSSWNSLKLKSERRCGISCNMRGTLPCGTLICSR